MKKLIVASVCLIMVTYVGSVWAYEPGTHATLTQNAIRQSVLVASPCGSCTTVLQDLGLGNVASQQFPDPQGWETVLRLGRTFRHAYQGTRRRHAHTGRGEHTLKEARAQEDGAWRTRCCARRCHHIHR